MTILIDTDVLMDVLVEREPFYRASAAVWGLAEIGRVEGLVSAISFANVFYILRKSLGAKIALASVQRVAQAFAVAPVDSAVVRDAIASGMPDFEDALQAFSGFQAGASHVVSRDARGFSNAPLIVVPPDQLPSLISAA